MRDVNSPSSVPGTQAVRRALEVLTCFEADRPVLTAPEVGVLLSLNRTTAWRYLQALVGGGLVREVGEGEFALAARTVRLADLFLQQWGDLAALSGEVLVDLRDEVGETAALHLRQGWSRVVVRQVASRHELRRTYRDVGEPISLLLGAPSRAILAALPDSERGAYLQARLGADERPPLEEELRRARERGWTLSHGARVPDVASVAAPVHGTVGEVLGAVNVTGPAHRLTEDRIPEVARSVTRAAARLSGRVSASTGTPPASG